MNAPTSVTVGPAYPASPTPVPEVVNRVLKVARRWGVHVTEVVDVEEFFGWPGIRRAPFIAGWAVDWERKLMFYDAKGIRPRAVISPKP